MNFRASHGFLMPPSGDVPLRGFHADGRKPNGSTPRSIHRYREELDGFPDVREDKVDDLRDAVENGDYYVESEKIAKRVVDEALKEAARRNRPSAR